MTIPESDLNYEHNTHRIKDILFRLFPNTRVQFNADWLNEKLPEKRRNYSFVYGEYTVIYSCLKPVCSPNGKKYHHYQIKGNTEKSQKKLKQVIEDAYRNNKSLTVQWEENNKDKNFKWFEFQSGAELAIAEELTKRKMLFFCNAKCLISNRYNEQEKMTPDFMVIYQGKARILEVDGKEYHKNHFQDYRRDRLFERHGLRVTRYTYDECIADPERVIDEFLELFEDGINYFHQLIRMSRSTEQNKYS
jgi:very-short-patch-repair endonuclease